MADRTPLDVLTVDEINSARLQALDHLLKVLLEQLATSPGLLDRLDELTVKLTETEPTFGGERGWAYKSVVIEQLSLWRSFVARPDTQPRQGPDRML